MAAILEAKKLKKQFGKFLAVDDVSFSLQVIVY